MSLGVKGLSNVYSTYTYKVQRTFVWIQSTRIRSKHGGIHGVRNHRDEIGVH